MRIPIQDYINRTVARDPDLKDAGAGALEFYNKLSEKHQQLFKVDFVGFSAIPGFELVAEDYQDNYCRIFFSVRSIAGYYTLSSTWRYFPSGVIYKGSTTIPEKMLALLDKMPMTVIDYINNAVAVHPDRKEVGDAALEFFNKLSENHQQLFKVKWRTDCFEFFAGAFKREYCKITFLMNIAGGAYILSSPRPTLPSHVIHLGDPIPQEILTVLDKIS